MTKKLVVAALLVPSLIWVCWTLVAMSTNSSTVDEQEYAVYSAVLNSRVLGQISREPGHLLIRGRTEERIPIGLSRGLRLVVWNHFNLRLWWLHGSLAAKSSTEAPLLDHFQTDYRHEVVDLDPDWNPGDRGLPYARFSRVGFTPLGGSALVFLSYYCGSLCGIGEYILLRRNSDGWEVVDEWVVWVS